MIYQGSVQHHGTLTPKSLLLRIKYSLSLMRRGVRWLRSGLVTHSHRVTDSRPPKLDEPVSTMPCSSHSVKTEWAWQQNITQGPVVFLLSLREWGRRGKTSSQRMLHGVACSFFKFVSFLWMCVNTCVWMPVGSRRRCLIPCCGKLLTVGPSARAARVVNCWSICPPCCLRATQPCPTTFSSACVLPTPQID